MKIGLCGTMSVGKTTLVNALKELPEFKDYMFRTERSKELMAQGIPLNTDSTLKGQTVFLARASKSINSPDKDLFEDYAKRFIKEYDYIFYVSPVGVEIEDNGIRETNVDYRDLIDYTISKILDEQKHRIKNLNTLSGSTEKRIEQMLEALSS